MTKSISTRTLRSFNDQKQFYLPSVIKKIMIVKKQSTKYPFLQISFVISPQIFSLHSNQDKASIIAHKYAQLLQNLWRRGKASKNSEANTFTVDFQIRVAVQWRLKTYKITFSKNRGRRKNWSVPDPTDPTGSAGPELNIYFIIDIMLLWIIMETLLSKGIELL